MAVHPEDERYKDFVGKEVEVPMSGGRKIPVVADEYVDREFGTGALKITPAHDPNDYEIGKRVGLEMMCIMNRDGTMNAEAGKYNGLDRFECRKQLWKDLEGAGLAIRREDYQTRCGFLSFPLHVLLDHEFSHLHGVGCMQSATLAERWGGHRADGFRAMVCANRRDGQSSFGRSQFWPDEDHPIALYQDLHQLDGGHSRLVHL
jgi:tRNA synthetases class I (I, L, M and V)